MFQQKAQYAGIMTSNMKYSDAAVRNGHVKPQSKYDSEKQMSDHPRDLIISGVTTCGSHKAEETATWLFSCDQRGSGKRVAASGSSSHSIQLFFLCQLS